MSAIVKVDAVDIAGELPQLFRLAQSLVKAGGFLPRHVRTEGELVAVILAGRELGLPPMTSLRSLHLVEGRVVVAADTQLALMVRAGATFQWLSDGRNGTAQLKLRRPGQQEHVQTYSIDDAKTAGLTGKNNWRNHPAAMLRARCVSAAARAYLPDVLAGVFIEDEAEEIRQSSQHRPASATRTATAMTRESVQDAEFEMVEPTVDEYGITVPSSECPIVDRDGPNKGKAWSELPGGLLEKMTAKYDEMSSVKREWLDYLLARRAARKAKESRDAESATSAVDAALNTPGDTSSDGGGWVAGDDREVPTGEAVST
jgi:hypothetical protein